MIDITKAQANQTVTNGLAGEWTVTLDGETLYKLPSHFSPQETFLVRDAVEVMMKRAATEAREQAIQLGIVTQNRIIENGNTQLDALKQENVRLATILEQLTEAA